MEISKALRAFVKETYALSNQAANDDDTVRLYAQRALKDGKLTPEKLQELLRDDDSKGPSPQDVFGGSEPKVKRPSERYKSHRTTGKHVKTGRPVQDEHGRDVELPSERDFALCGAFLKDVIRRGGGNVELDDHERELLTELRDHHEWCGKIGSEWHERIPASRAKALLDDSTSGGLEIAPIVFDQNIVTFPLLHSELLPFIDLQNISRGRRIEGASVSNPTVTWGTPDGTEISLFDTSSLVAAIDTNIHNVVVGVEIGLDFLSDAAVDVGRVLQQNIGQRMLETLDDQIANGDGVTEPEGIRNASGLSSVSSENGNSGPPTVTDYESLWAGIGKQYRNSNMRPAYIANDTSYQRARGVAVSGSDQRRVFGLNEQSYMLLEFPYRIQQSIPNTDILFGALAKYRMYRRQGAETKFETGGKELTRKNLGLLTVRGRWGGKVVDSNAFAKMTDAQS